VQSKIVLDVSVRDQKGLGRFLDMIIDGLKITPYEVVYFGKMHDPFSVKAFFRIPPLRNNYIYIFPHINIPLVMLLSKSKIILCIHDTIPFKRPTLKTYIWKQLICHISKKSNVTIVCPSLYSLNEASKTLGFPSSKGRVVHNRYTKDIALARDPACIVSNRVNCIYIGNNLPHKNVQIIIDALTLIYSGDSNNQDIRLKLFFGKAAKQREFLNIPKQISRYISIYPQISDNELSKQMQQAHVLIQPSLHEGFGIPILEALGAGLKCIASDIPVFKELFGDCLSYFNAYDPHQLSKLLLNIHELPSPDIDKVKQCLERYTFANTSLKFAELINDNDTTT
jgi:glycosyltransferase involved in cell wall biosynthesis